MERIEEGIVFSNDIEKIMKGENALDFRYEDRGLVLPSCDFYKEIRNHFKENVEDIFDNQVRILTEEEMMSGMQEAVADVLGRYPHCNAR